MGKLIVLTEGIKSPELGAYAGVYKYQSSAQIVREVMACYGEERSVLPVQSPVLKKATQILGVYSPVGRCLKTSFALTPGSACCQGKTCFVSESGRIFRDLKNCLERALQEH